MYNKYINNNISNYILRIKNINNILNQNIYNNIDSVLDNIENIIYNIQLIYTIYIKPRFSQIRGFIDVFKS